MFVCNNRCWKFELASASSSGGKTSSGSAKKRKLSLTSTKLAGSLLSRQWLVIAFHIPSWKREERYTGTTHSKSAAGGEPDILAYSPYKICPDMSPPPPNVFLTLYVKDCPPAALSWALERCQKMATACTTMGDSGVCGITRLCYDWERLQYYK